MRYLSRIIAPVKKHPYMARIMLAALFLAPIAAGAQYYVEHANYEGGYGPYDYADGNIGVCGGWGTSYQYQSTRCEDVGGYPCYDEFYTYYATDHYCEANEKFDGYSCYADASCGAPAPTCADSGQVGTYPNCSAPPPPPPPPTCADSGMTGTYPNCTTPPQPTCADSGQVGTYPNCSAPSTNIPTVTLTPSPRSVYAGQLTTLTWSSTDATSCSATGTGFSTGGATSGSAVVDPSQDTQHFYGDQNYAVQYTVQCTGPGGTNSAWETVYVAQEPAGACSATITAGEVWTLSVDASYSSPPGYETVGIDVASNNIYQPASYEGYSSWGGPNHDWHLIYSPGTYQIEVWAGSSHPDNVGSITVKAYGEGLEGDWTDTTTWNTSSAPPMYYPRSNAVVRCTIHAVAPPSPDLIGGAPTVTGSTIVGQTLNLSAQASNVGTAAAGAFTSYFKISNGANAWTGQVASLGANASAWVGADYSFPAAGTYTIQLCVDGNGQVAESSEDNNCGPSTSVTVHSVPTAALSLSPNSISYGGSSALAWSSTGATSCTGTGFSTGGATSGSLTVSPTVTTTYYLSCSGPGGTSPTQVQTLTVGAQPIPDLTSGVGSGMTVAAGTPFTMNGTTYNVGSGSAAAGFQDLFIVYQADQSTWAGYQYASASGAIAASGSAARSASYAVSVPGTYYYRLCADWSGAVSESNEGNNCSAFQTLVVRPAAPTGLSSSCSVTGTQVTLSWSATPGADNYYVRTGQGGPSTDGHGGTSITYAVTPNQYYDWWVIANVGPANYDSTHYGDASYGSFTCAGKADLAAGTTVATPSSVTRGASMNFSAPATNGGTAASNAFPILFQVQETGALFQSGYLSGLAVGATGWGGADYVFSSSGTYHVRACANYNTAWTAIATESDYGNNCGPYATVTVSNPAPAACTVYATPATVGSGGSAVLTWSSSNASSCTGTGFSTGGATSGSASVSPGATTNYGLSCSGTGGSCSASAQVFYDVCSTGATADIQANGSNGPIRVHEGDAITISWSASGVRGTCTVTDPSGATLGSGTSSGAPSCTVPTSPIPATAKQGKYTVSCTGATDSVQVNLIPKFTEF